MNRTTGCLFLVAVLVTLCTAADYSASVPVCPTTTSLSAFILDDGSGKAVQQTNVTLCHDDNGIQVEFGCVDDNPRNPYTECNDPLYEYSVVEMFVAPASDASAAPYVYVELEVSPNGVLFVANITNTNGDCSGISDVLLPCSTSGLEWSATRDDANDRWSASLYVPFSLWPGKSSADTWLANFFRIDTPKGMSKEYSCWSPTMASPACFHRPKYFGSLELLQ
ncbi:hypothetical protein Pelo_6297 [Pelomyxa schiedti]|nr:hypothetical protein Pelo_6297 [Pelomyxa schiedti]